MPKPKNETGPTYVLRVCDRFEAAHHLYAYRGRSEPVHGHSWKVEVVIETKKLNAEGTTIVQVTHSERNAEYGKRTIHMLDGWIDREERNGSEG